jgi:hypothetical protein
VSVVLFIVGEFNGWLSPHKLVPSPDGRQKISENEGLSRWEGA